MPDIEIIPDGQDREPARAGKGQREEGDEDTEE